MRMGFMLDDLILIQDGGINLPWIISQVFKNVLTM